MKDEIKLACVAIMALVLLESVAMTQGINGNMLRIIIFIIAGLGGWAMPQLKLPIHKA